MRREVLLWTGIAAVFVAAAAFEPTGGLKALGVTSAEAKEYYTKRRVNGRWITGRFARRGAGPQTNERATGPDPSTSVRVGTATERTFVPPSAAPVRAPLVAAAQAASLPAVSSPAVAAVQVAPARPVALAQAAPAESAPLVPAPEGERLDKLRQALQARASALTGADVAPAGTRPEPHSVSLDFQSGIKTTLFSDGSMVREPFDVAALRGLAAAPSEARRGP